MFDDLISHGSNPAQADNLVTDAAMCGRTDIIQHLHSLDIDLNQLGMKGYRPIEAAIGMGHLPAVDYLLEAKVDISFIDTSKPLVPWKGSLTDPQTMETICERIKAKKTEQGAAANP
jgi:ankyrin repeat protein